MAGISTLPTSTGASAHDTQIYASATNNITCVFHGRNEVCNGGAIAAALALLDSSVPAQKALASAVLQNATQNIRVSEMHGYSPDGAWSEGPTYWGYATKYSLVAIQMLTTATGSDTGLGRAPGFDRTGTWRIQNTGPLDKMFN